MITRAGAGNFQGADTPRLLISAQKGAQKTTKHQNTRRDRAAQERVRRKYDGGGQEARDWIHSPPEDWQGLGLRSRPAGGGEWFKECQRKEKTYKGLPIGVDRDTKDAEGGKMGSTRRGTRRQKRACEAGLNGLRETWGAG